MIPVKREGVILKPTDNNFEKQAVLNPGVYQDGDNVHVIYRAIDENFVSRLGYALLSGPLEVKERWDRPFMEPKLKIESRGLEDPRLVKIEDTFYLTYVAHDGKNAVSAYATGPDLFNLKRDGVISPQIKYRDAAKVFSYTKLKDEYYFFESFYREYNGQNILIWHKDCILFPEKIDGNFLMLERILPDIQLVSCESLHQLKDKYFWIYHLMNLSIFVLIEPEHGFEARHVGGGCPPVKTPAGWLLIYHSAQEFNKKRVYHAGAALLDLKQPQKVIARLPEPLFSPMVDFELAGTVNNVVFPTGTAVFGDTLYIYYGAADTVIAAASVKLDDLINELLKHKR
ncbi:MAG: pesticidal protein Cry7Aa [Planctomycetes bacterium]|jgi:predicted GH43/DUF377 family glycosyl hydrolase|nr:pesticidal protein Cry7Aa [Planctomycetota bacterium]